MAINNFGQLSFGRENPKFVGVPVEDMRKAAETFQERYHTNVQGYDKLNTIANNIKVRQWNEPIKKKAIDKIQSSINELTTDDAFIYAEDSLRQTANDFQNNKDLQIALLDKHLEDVWDEDAKTRKVSNERINAHKLHHMRSGKQIEYDEKTGQYKNVFNHELAADEVDLTKFYMDLAKEGKVSKNVFSESKYDKDGKLIKGSGGLMTTPVFNGEYYGIIKREDTDDQAKLESLMTMAANDPKVAAYLKEQSKFKMLSLAAVDENNKYILDNNGNYQFGTYNPMDGTIIPTDFEKQWKDLGYTDVQLQQLLSKQSSNDLDINLDTFSKEERNNFFKDLYTQSLFQSVNRQNASAATRLTAVHSTDIELKENHMMLEALKFKYAKKLKEYEVELQSSMLPLTVADNTNTPTTLEEYNDKISETWNTYDNNYKQLDAALRTKEVGFLNKDQKLMPITVNNVTRMAVYNTKTKRYEKDGNGAYKYLTPREGINRDAVDMLNHSFNAYNRQKEFITKTILNNTPNINETDFKDIIENAITTSYALKGDMSSPNIKTEIQALKGKSRAEYNKYLDKKLKSDPTFAKSFMYEISYGKRFLGRVANDTKDAYTKINDELNNYSKNNAVITDGWIPGSQLEQDNLRKVAIASIDVGNVLYDVNFNPLDEGEANVSLDAVKDAMSNSKNKYVVPVVHHYEGKTYALITGLRDKDDNVIPSVRIPIENYKLNYQSKGWNKVNSFNNQEDLIHGNNTSQVYTDFEEINRNQGSGTIGANLILPNGQTTNQYAVKTEWKNNQQVLYVPDAQGKIQTIYTPNQQAAQSYYLSLLDDNNITNTK